MCVFEVRGGLCVCIRLYKKKKKMTELWTAHMNKFLSMANQLGVFVPLFACVC